MASTKIEKSININDTFLLMHKNIEVCQISFVGDGTVDTVNIYEDNAKYMPIGSSKDIYSFRQWWANRAIPKTRNNAKPALEKLGYANTSEVLLNNLALSLNDCYWIKPSDSSLKWEDVNLFTNDFEDIFGDLTLENNRKVDIKDKTKFNSATSPGELQKKWCIGNKSKRILIKGNYGLSYQQSLNEVFASNLHSKQSFDNYVEYTLTNLSLSNNTKGLGCSCYCFCNENVESISLSSITTLDKKRNDESYFSFIKKLCLQLGIKEKEFDDYFDYMILTDFLLTNVDRHLNNISILRNPNNLEIIGFSPIYDFGNSMFYNTSTADFDDIDIYHIKVNSIVDEEMKMLKYVKNRNAVNLNNLDVDFSIYDNDVKENQIRKNHYIEMFNKKRELLQMFQDGINVWKH